MPQWIIPVTWEMCGCVKVEADRLEDAMDYVKNEGDHIKLPKESSYVNGSFDLSQYETECIREAYNNNQQDMEEDKNDR